MFFEVFIGTRYLKAKRKQAFISVISVISVLGIMVGVMALIVVLSVMNGFRSDLMSKIQGVNAHILVRHYGGAFNNYDKVLEDINGIEGVVGVTPSIYSQVMLNHRGMVSGAVLRGIDIQTVSRVIDIEPMINHGTISSLTEIRDGVPAIIVGSQLAGQIGVFPGDILTVISPQGRLTPLGRTPNSREYRVSALFDSGMYEYDLSMAYVSLKEAQDFLGIEGRITGVEVKVEDPYRSNHVAVKIADKLGDPYGIQDWKARHRTLFEALKLEKTVMFVILIMIVLVGALNIISTLVMVVMEKSRDVAILRAMGATKRSIMSIFVFNGLVVGLLGTLSGLFSGLVICHLLSKYKFIDLPSDIYYISTLPVRVETLDVVMVTIAALIISLLATLYPSWHASRLNPVEVLRYE